MRKRYALAIDIKCLDGTSPDPCNKSARCLLVLRKCQGLRHFTFHPLAFHPAHGKFSSPRSSAFLMDNNFAVMQDNIPAQRSQCAEDDLIATKGVATTALTLPNREGLSFARERQRIETAIQDEEYAFEMEQVLLVQVSKLSDDRRSFSAILSPIFQLMRFFHEEPQCCTYLFRAFRPSISPSLLSSFASLFARAIDSIHARFEAAGSQGLCGLPVRPF
ncbi:hypothetical protein PSPO01_16159 [Paraphaeosphaeria sporulosa]